MSYQGLIGPVRLSPIAAALAVILVSTNIYAEEVPPGFHVMPDGRMMANNPATAIAPPGYYLRSNGMLIKLDDDVGDVREAQAAPVPQPKSDEIPSGFHRMPDGRIMANNPATAVAPTGYHLMGDGVLMSNSGGSGGHEHLHSSGHHGAGMWMFEYRYSRMNMSDMLDTTTVVTPEEVVASPYNYMMSPTTMSMDMHMFMAMYGVTDNVTAMAMLHYMSNKMGMKASDGTISDMSSSGLGDTVLTLLYTTPYKVTLGLGGGLPTGSINAIGNMMMSAAMNMTGVTLPYGMQLGSGSFEFRPSIAYSDRFSDFTVGSEFEYIYRANDNPEGYRLGNKSELTVWGEWHAMKYFSVLARSTFSDIEKISGKHENISTTMNHGGMDMPGSPAANPELYGGMRLDASLGFKVNTADNMWALKTEFTMPMYQNLWGPQMRTTWIASVGLEAMF